MAVALPIALAFLAAFADPARTSAQALEMSLAGCETWMTDETVRRSGARPFANLGLRPETTAPQIPGVPASIENSAAVHRFRIGFAEGDVWLVVATMCLPVTPS